jgi:hypothetical protein
MHTKERHNDIDQLIIFYLSGKMDKESFAALKSWSMASEANRAYIRSRLEIWFSSGVSGDTTTFNKDKAFGRFKQRVAKAGKQGRNIRHFPWKIVYRIAVVILALLLPLAAYRKRNGKENFRGHGCRSADGGAYKTLFTRRYISMVECRLEGCLFARFRCRRQNTDT